MAILNIRQLPDEVHARLRLRAAKAGRSMEAEARDILTKASRSEDVPPSAMELQTMVDKLYGKKRPKKVVGALLKERRRAARSE